MYGLLLLFCLALAALIVGFIGAVISQNNRRKELIDLKENIYNYIRDKLNFNINKITYGYPNQRLEINSVMAVDDESERIALLTIKNFNEISSSKIYNYSDIISSEIFEDTSTIIKTQRSSQLIGTAIGGVLGGATGAVIGGLSGSQKQKQIIKKLGLKIIVNDIVNPIYEFIFLEEPHGIDKENIIGKKIYEAKLKEAEEWHGVFTIAIKKSERVQQKEGMNFK